MDRTTIGRTIEIEGDLASEDPVVIHGQLRGTIDAAEDVVVESSATVDGIVQAETVHVSGTVEGRVEATTRIEITAEGRVAGDLASPRVQIADGAKYRGHIEMDGWQSSSRS
ncbi:MAG: polymer-forming cytoskeletal protein [Deltaproteobacteria bacterium]